MHSESRIRAKLCVSCGHVCAASFLKSWLHLPCMFHVVVNGTCCIIQNVSWCQYLLHPPNLLFSNPCCSSVVLENGRTKVAKFLMEQGSNKNLQGEDFETVLWHNSIYAKVLLFLN